MQYIMPFTYISSANCGEGTSFTTGWGGLLGVGEGLGLCVLEGGLGWQYAGGLGVKTWSAEGRLGFYVMVPMCSRSTRRGQTL